MTTIVADPAAAYAPPPATHGASGRLPVLLGLIGAVCGIAVHALVPQTGEGPLILLASLAAGAAAAGLGSALLLRLDGRALARSVLVVALGAILYGLAASVTARQSVGGAFGDGNIWPTLAMTTALLLAAPFLARWIDGDGDGHGAGRIGLDRPAEIIRPFWIVIAMLGVGALFVLATLALMALLAFLLTSLGFAGAGEAVFQGATPVAAAFGALGLAIGTMRQRPQMTDTLLRLAGAILGLLTPVAMVIVGGFLLLLLGQLATGGVTALSVGTAALAAGLVAAVLLNAVYADPDTPGGEGTVARPVAGWRRWPAMVLAGAILPLGLVAAYALGVRIADHGLTHERLWGIVAAVLAIAYGIACLLAVRAGAARFEGVLGHHQGRWMAGAAVVLAVMALQPVDFGRLAVSDQLARLADGRTRPHQFDAFALLRSGPAGKAAVERLARAPGPVQVAARLALYGDVADRTPSSARANIVGIDQGLVIDDATLSALDDGSCSRPCRIVRVSRERAMILTGFDLYLNSRLLRIASDGRLVAIADSAARAVKEVEGSIEATDVITLRPTGEQEVLINGKPSGVRFDPDGTADLP